MLRPPPLIQVVELLILPQVMVPPLAATVVTVARMAKMARVLTTAKTLGHPLPW